MASGLVWSLVLEDEGVALVLDLLASTAGDQFGNRHPVASKRVDAVAKSDDFVVLPSEESKGGRGDGEKGSAEMRG